MAFLKALCVALVFTTSALAQSPAAAPIELTEPQQARAQTLYKEIRCPVCTAQAVAESDASLSIDLRRQIAALIVSGQSDGEIVSELKLAYGEDISLRPATEVRTLPLWAAPWIVLLLGVSFILMRRRRA